jgi:hypothetical protein
VWAAVGGGGEEGLDRRDKCFSKRRRKKNKIERKREKRKK